MSYVVELSIVAQPVSEQKLELHMRLKYKFEDERKKERTRLN